MISVEYSFYINTYRGTMPEADFARLSLKASAYIHRATLGRAECASETELPAVKLAVCEVADTMSKLENGGDVAAATNDGVSVTYASRGQTNDAKRLYDAAALWLATTGLLYRGCG